MGPGSKRPGVARHFVLWSKLQIWVSVSVPNVLGPRLKELKNSSLRGHVLTSNE